MKTTKPTIHEHVDSVEVDQANAHLIAAAPELLAALETLWAALTIDECQRIEDQVGPVYALVASAIAKAKGKTK